MFQRHGTRVSLSLNIADVAPADRSSSGAIMYLSMVIGDAREEDSWIWNHGA